MVFYCEFNLPNGKLFNLNARVEVEDLRTRHSAITAAHILVRKELPTEFEAQRYEEVASVMITSG